MRTTVLVAGLLALAAGPSGRRTGATSSTARCGPSWPGTASSATGPTTRRGRRSRGSTCARRPSAAAGRAAAPSSRENRTENPLHPHALRATILHLLGFDHEKLTARHAGRDCRLTDVHGHVIKDLLA